MNNATPIAEVIDHPFARDQKPCYLRATRVTLKGGRRAVFRALPLNRRTTKILSTLTSKKESEGGEVLNALIEACEISLGYDQSPEEISEILDSGAIPFFGGDEADEAIKGAVTGAMISHMQK